MHVGEAARRRHRNVLRLARQPASARRPREAASLNARTGARASGRRCPEGAGSASSFDGIALPTAPKSKGGFAPANRHKRAVIANTPGHG